MSTETERNGVELGRVQPWMGKAGSKELRSRALNLRCLRAIYLGLSSRLLVSLRTRDIDFIVFSRKKIVVETGSE